MAGEEIELEMVGEESLPTWRTIIELAESGISQHWTLVGGLMVDIHARRAGITMHRPTDDIDVVVDYMGNRSTLIHTRRALDGIGFQLRDSGKYAYRFTHPDGRKVDVMVADHLPSRMEPRLGRKPAFAAPSGEQAIRRRDMYRLRFSGGLTIGLGVPDDLGALVAKGAAWIVDNRDRTRHLDDGAVLFACVRDASAIDYKGMSKNDKKRIGAISEQLSHPAHPSWMGLDQAGREKGFMNLAFIRQGMVSE